MTNKEYKPLIIPQLEWEKKTLVDHYGKLVAQPLEPGFGVTLGNALRRILLGGVEGAAVTSVIIEGVNNEFSILPNILEDAMQIVLNLKGIVLRNTEGKSGKMHLSLSGERTVTVNDIVPDAHLELINKDHVLAHIAPGGSLDIQFFVEPGRGYQPAQWPEGKPLQEDHRIYLDAMFSPVRKVTFNVEKTRVGKDIDYDKLTLEIYTDASENPLDVLHYAVSVLRSQLEHFLASAEIPFNTISGADEVEQEVEQQSTEVEEKLKGISVEHLVKPIEELELSVRAHNCLVHEGIKRVVDLVNCSEDEVLKFKNFGRKSLDEVKESLQAFGLKLGTEITEADLKKMMKTGS